MRDGLERIGFKQVGERMIRGGVVDPQPREIAERALFHQHHLHQETRHENETLALRKIKEIRDDFALRGRCEVFRTNLKSMASANRLHKVSTCVASSLGSYEYFETCSPSEAFLLRKIWSISLNSSARKPIQHLQRTACINTI